MSEQPLLNPFARPVALSVNADKGGRKMLLGEAGNEIKTRITQSYGRVRGISVESETDLPSILSPEDEQKAESMKMVDHLIERGKRIVDEIEDPEKKMAAYLELLDACKITYRTRQEVWDELLEILETSHIKGADRLKIGNILLEDEELPSYLVDRIKSHLEKFLQFYGRDIQVKIWWRQAKQGLEVDELACEEVRAKAADVHIDQQTVIYVSLARVALMQGWNLGPHIETIKHRIAELKKSTMDHYTVPLFAVLQELGQYALVLEEATTLKVYERRFMVLRHLAMDPQAPLAIRKSAVIKAREAANAYTTKSDTWRLNAILASVEAELGMKREIDLEKWKQEVAPVMPSYEGGAEQYFYLAKIRGAYGENDDECIRLAKEGCKHDNRNLRAAKVRIVALCAHRVFPDRALFEKELLDQANDPTINGQDRTELVNVLCETMSTSHPDAIEPFLDEKETYARTRVSDRSEELGKLVEWAATASKTLYNKLHPIPKHALVS